MLIALANPHLQGLAVGSGYAHAVHGGNQPIHVISLESIEPLFCLFRRSELLCSQAFAAYHIFNPNSAAAVQSGVEIIQVGRAQKFDE